MDKVRVPRGVKAAIRIAGALFGALFGSLAVSVQVCTSAAHAPTWPHWADIVCGHNIWLQWLMSIPVLFALLSFLLGASVRRSRVHIVVLVLAAFGIYAAFNSLENRSWWWVEVPVLALAAAFGVALRKRWARYVVYALTLVYAVAWGYSICRGVVVGLFHEYGAARSVLSLLPGIAFALVAAFCCYVVTFQLTSGDGGSTRDDPPIPSTRGAP